MNSRNLISATKNENAAPHKSMRKNNSENGPYGTHEDQSYPQSLSKTLQPQKSIIQDSQLDLIYLKDILDYLQMMKLYPLGDLVQDVREFRQQIKSCKFQVSTLLHLLTQSIDPFMDIKSFQDDKLLILMKKFGYPIKISRTRMMALGSSHTLTQTLHLLKWIQTLGVSINHYQDDVGDDHIEDLIERAITREFRESKPNSNNVKQLIENQQIELNSRVEEIKSQKQIIQDQLSFEKSTQPRIQPLEDEIQALEMKRVEFETLIVSTDADIRQVNQEEHQIVQRIQDQQQEIQTLKQSIEAIKIRVDNQNMNQQQSNELIQKTNHNNFQLKKYLDEVQKLQNVNKEREDSIINSQQQIEQIIFDFNNIIEQSDLGLQPLPIKYNIFERVPLQIQLKETKNGVDDIMQDEDLMSGEVDYQELEMQQKIIEDRQQNQTKKRKSVQIYDFIIKRDVKQTFNLMFPQTLRKPLKSTLQQQSQAHQQTMLQNEIKLVELQEQMRRQELQEKQLNQERIRLEQTYQTLIHQEQNQDNIKLLYSEYEQRYQVLVQEKQKLLEQHLKFEEQLCFEEEDLGRFQANYDSQEAIYASKIQQCEQIEIQALNSKDDLESYTQSLLKDMQTKMMALNDYVLQ